MHKVTYLLLRYSYAAAVVFLLMAILSLITIGSDISRVGHTLILVREMCSTGAVILIISLLGSAILQEKLQE